MSLVRQNESKATLNYAAKCSQIAKKKERKKEKKKEKEKKKGKKGNVVEKSSLISVFLLIFDILRQRM
jgi:hypothetical protein